MTDLDAIRASVRFFATVGELRAWFLEHHRTESEIWIGYPKKGVDHPGISYDVVVDEALCFGWVDGLVRSLGPETYANRYTPRKSKSPWSQINIAKVGELTRSGRMHPSGLAVFERRHPARAGYSFEERPRALDPALEKEFRRDRAAWAHFEALPPGYRRTAIFWVQSAKRPETRARRLGTLITASRNGRRVDPLDPGRYRVAASVRPRSVERVRSRPKNSG
jgi:uncharacterized protein YdeI (YjbR/CyaY-like superfamily)